MPTPAAQNLSKADLIKLARLIKRPPEKVKERFARGKSVTVLTVAHPRIAGLIDLIICQVPGIGGPEEAGSFAEFFLVDVIESTDEEIVGSLICEMCFFKCLDIEHV